MRGIIIKLNSALLLILLFALTVSAEEIDVTRDANGWSVFVPHADARIMYVDPVGGDDGAAVYYAPSHAAVGSDPFDPIGPIAAYSTFTEALGDARTGYGDWILLKKGIVLRENTGSGGDPYVTRRLPAGLSAAYPTLFGTYGTGAMPRVETRSMGIDVHGAASYVAVQGIDFYAYTRDPENVAFVPEGDNSSAGLHLFSAGSAVSTGRLIEGCKFRFFYNNGHVSVLAGDWDAGARMDGITIRRTSFLDAFPVTADGRAQGLLMGSAGVTVDECIFDHNGWFVQDGSNIGNSFSQNIYMGSMQGVTVKNTISSRPASIGIKNASYGVTGPGYGHDVTWTDNLIVDAEVALSYWALAVTDGGLPGDEDVVITGNVVSHTGTTRPTNRSLAWGFDPAGINRLLFADNLFVDQAADQPGYLLRPRGYLKDAVFSGNVFHDIPAGYGINPTVDTSNPYNTDSSIEFRENIFDLVGNVNQIAYAAYDISGTINLADNTYYNAAADGTRFYHNGINRTDAQWISETGDNSAFTQPTFTDDTRSIESYLDSIGETATIASFYLLIRSMGFDNWDTRLTAPAVNSYIRTGFDMTTAALTCAQYAPACTVENCETDGWYWYDDSCHGSAEGTPPTTQPWRGPFRIGGASFRMPREQ